MDTSVSSDQLAREVRRTRVVSDANMIVTLAVVESLLVLAGSTAGWIAVTTSSPEWRAIMIAVVVALIVWPTVWAALYRHLVVIVIPGGTDDW